MVCSLGREPQVLVRALHPSPNGATEINRGSVALPGLHCGSNPRPGACALILTHKLKALDDDGRHIV
jgi:hypothetical protein